MKHSWKWAGFVCIDLVQSLLVHLTRSFWVWTSFHSRPNKPDYRRNWTRVFLKQTKQVWFEFDLRLRESRESSLFLKKIKNNRCFFFYLLSVSRLNLTPLRLVGWLFRRIMRKLKDIFNKSWLKEGRQNLYILIWIWIKRQVYAWIWSIWGKKI